MTTNEPPSLAQQRFGQRAERYVTSPEHAQGDDLDRLLAIADPQPHWAVLDVATGGGHTALKLAPHVAHVVASDITAQMLSAARGFILGQGVENVTFREADAEALPFEDAAFDLVTCRIAPHHFDDAARFVHEAARVLKPGGVLLVQDHLGPPDEAAAQYVEAFERLRDPSHNHAYSEAEWRGMMEDAGLRVTHVEEVIKVLSFVPWAQRQDCSPQVVARLIEMQCDAPASVRAWLGPEGIGTPQATFLSRHIIITGRKDKQKEEARNDG